MKRTRRILAIALGLVMLLGMLPAPSLAATQQEPTATYCPSGRSGNHTHSFTEWDEMLTPTCTEAGSRSRWCQYCWYEEKQAISALGHSWGAWSTIQEATCSAEGSRLHTCTVCGATETGAIPKKEHTWGKSTVLVDPTCSYEGTIAVTCQVCGTQETRAVSRLPHTWSEWTVTAEPTCTQEGSRERVCSVCGQKETESLPMLPHTYGDWTAITAATCTSSGEEKGVCQVCGHEEIRAVAQLSHSYGAWNVISPLTDLSLGVRERVCQACGVIEHVEEEPAGTLHRGDKGPSVVQLQKALNNAGFDCGYADGDFGGLTENALKNFEKENGFPEDGIGWPGFLRMILPDGTEVPEDMTLAALLDATAGTKFAEDDLVWFEITLVNKYAEDITEFTIYQKTTNAAGTSEWQGVYTGGALAAGGEAKAPVQYTVSFADAEGAWVNLEWYASAKTVSGTTIYSNADFWTLDCSSSLPDINIFPEESPVTPFAPGANIPISIGVLNESEVPVKVLSIVAGENDIIEDRTWMHEALEPHMLYHFDLTMVLSDYEAAQDEAYHTITITVVDDATGEHATDGAHVFAVRKVEGASICLIPEDTTSMHGDLGDWVSVPILVVNNGTADLAVDGFDSLYTNFSLTGDTFSFDDQYKTLFAAGDSFWLNQEVLVSLYDVKEGAVKRWTEPIAHKAGDAGAKVSDQVSFSFGFDGPIADVTLNLSQVTPGQETWTPDASGKIADIEYSGLLSNVGDRTVLVRSLSGYLYPDTEASVEFKKFDPPLVLPGKSTLPVALTVHLTDANITPGSATETIDGLIELDIHASLADESAPDVTYDSSNEVSFQYKIKNDAFSWAPPTEVSPASAEAEAEEYDISHMGVLKGVVNKSALSSKYYWLSNPFCVNETIQYAIEVYCFKSENMYDIEVVDECQGVETVIATIPQLSGSDPVPTYLFTHTVTPEDAQIGVVRNRVWVTFRPEGSEERLKCEPYWAPDCEIIDLPAPSGTLSEDIQVVKSASYDGHPVLPTVPNHVPENTEVTYEIKLTNTTKKTIENIFVIDPLSGTPAPTAFATVASLAPGESTTVKYNYTVDHDDVVREFVFNTAVATWVDESGAPLFNYDQCKFDTTLPRLVVTKTVTSEAMHPKGYEEGETVHYKIDVTNTMAEDQAVVEVRDHLYATPENPKGYLTTSTVEIPHGETRSFEFDYIVTKDDVDAGKIVNVAVVDWPLNESFQSNSVETPTVGKPANVLVDDLLTNSSTIADGWALYETAQGVIKLWTVSEVPVTNVKVYELRNEMTYEERVLIDTVPLLEPMTVDPVTGETALHPVELPPWSMTVAQEDVDRGYMFHKVIIEWDDPITGSHMSQGTIGINMPTISGGIEIYKSEDSTPLDPSLGYQLGEKASGTITVENHSHVAYHSVAVYDLPNGDTEGTLLGTIPTLLPLATQTLSWEMTVSQEDIDRGSMTNGARVVWKDPYTEEEHTNEAPEISMPTWGEKTPVYGGIYIYKEVVNVPANDMFFVEGETIQFKVFVSNPTGKNLTDYVIYEPMSPGGVLASGGAAAAGAVLADDIVPYWVTGIDAVDGSVTNVVTVHAIAEDGTKYIAMSEPVKALTGIEGDYILEKTVDWKPKNGYFYTEGEAIDYEISFTNNSDHVVDEVGISDWFDVYGPTSYDPIYSVGPGETVSVKFQWTVNYDDCVRGGLVNYAQAVVWYDTIPMHMNAIPVVVMTGFNKPKPKPTPIPEPAPETTPTPEATPAPEEPAKEYCERTLTGKGMNVREYSLEYCQEHAAIAEAVRALVDQGAPDAWEQAVALWTEAVNAEYDELIAASTETGKALLMDERVLFFIQLDCRRASLEQEAPENAAMLISEQLMNKCADLCYEAHAETEERSDSQYNGLWTETIAPEAAETCLRVVAADGTLVRYQEDLCQRHRKPEQTVDALLRDSDSLEKRANAWQSAKHLWLVELDALTNEKYLAADAAGRAIIAAERVSFGNWLNARETLLQLMYPGRPEIVNEVIADTIRARVIDLCGK